MLRKLAVSGVILAVVALWLGRMPGRHVVRDLASCDLQIVKRVPGAFIDEVKRYRVEPASQCELDVREVERPALPVDAQLALVAIALAGLLAIAWPKRWAAGIWLVIGATATFLAFVTTRSFDIRADDTTYLWPFHAARLACAGVASCLLAVAAWLIGPRRDRLPSAIARRRL